MLIGEGSGGEHKHRTPSLALVPPSAYPMRERSPVPCAQPSPRGDAPSPLAFAKSCKGGDVSVLDPALAWDVRCMYVFIYYRVRDWHCKGDGLEAVALTDAVLLTEGVVGLVVRRMVESASTVVLAERTIPIILRLHPLPPPSLP